MLGLARWAGRSRVRPDEVLGCVTILLQVRGGGHRKREQETIRAGGFESGGWVSLTSDPEGEREERDRRERETR